MSYFFGVVLVAAGIAMVIKTEWLIQNFGTNAWAEEHLGYNGGSRIFYKFIGLGGIFVGLMLITGLFGPFMQATLVKLFVR